MYEKKNVCYPEGQKVSNFIVQICSNFFYIFKNRRYKFHSCLLLITIEGRKINALISEFIEVSLLV